MTDEEIKVLIRKTKEAIKDADKYIDDLKKVGKEPHNSMIFPIWKIQDNLKEDLEKLEKLEKEMTENFFSQDE